MHTLDVDIFRLTRRAAMIRPGAPWLLDAFCGAGGAALGYWLAGFNVLGVDIAPQPNYPFVFVRGDAIEFVRQYGAAFDAIHASPVCKGYSGARRLAVEHAKEHPLQIADVRAALLAAGVTYVIENVAGAQRELHSPVMLCGAQFGLKVYRHRYFESNVLLFHPPHQPHRDTTPPAGRGRSGKGYFSLTSGGITGVSQSERFAGMDIYWMTNTELNESIPPAMTLYIGQQLMRAVAKHAVAQSA